MRRPLPNFLVIGAPRCASTALCRRLSEHPNVFISDPKETFFFSHNSKYSSAAGWEWYTHLFAGAKPQHLAIGEGTTEYSNPTRLSLILPRFKEHIPGARFIYIVRHPLRRIESAWRLHVALNKSGGCFPDEIRRVALFVQFSSYWKTLDAYAAAFGRQRIHVVFQEDFSVSPERELRRCFEHLEVDHKAAQIMGQQVVNPSSHLRRESAILRTLRAFGAVSVARQVLPSSVKDLARLAFTSKAVTPIAWDAAVLRFVQDELRPGIERFLTECSKPPTFWDLSH